MSLVALTCSDFCRPTNNSQAFAYHKVSNRQRDDDDVDNEEYGRELAEELELVPPKYAMAEEAENVA